MMLLQLRSNNIIGNTYNETYSIMKEQSRDKYLKRIDQLEEIAKK